MVFRYYLMENEIISIETRARMNKRYKGIQKKLVSIAAETDFSVLSQKLMKEGGDTIELCKHK